MVEKMLMWLDKFRELRSIRLRYFNACGAEPASGLGERHEPETHLIPLILRAVQTGTPVTLFGDDYPTPDGTCIRDYIHVSDLAEAYAALRSLIPITTTRPPNHDQLQAIVAGLPGLALEERNTAAARIVGNPPRREDGHWREGFIVLPVPPTDPVKPVALRWLH